jgi:hypothetical protein
MADRLQQGMAAYAGRLQARSAAVPRTLNRKIGAIATAWLIVFGLASVLRLLFPASPFAGMGDFLATALPYLLIALAPIAGYRIAAGSFPDGVITAQPDIRLAIYGKWRRLSVLDARANPAFGPTGFMASLLIGLLLNVVLRSFEFLTAMPAVSGGAPAWSQALFHLMAADVVIMSFFYMICYVLALRSVPLFPRMLLFAWALDIAAQMFIANQIAAMPGLPLMVAEPLKDLLYGNIQKVFISMFVWLPYLILSERVNITYRQRCSS